MTAVEAPLAVRVRAALAAEPSAREVVMFGGVSFMVHDKMVVATDRDGDLLVRVDPQRDHELLALPGTEPAEMGAGRPMGPGWLSVTAQAVATDEQLSFWIETALTYNARTRRATR